MINRSLRGEFLLCGLALFTAFGYQAPASALTVSDSFEGPDCGVGQAIDPCVLGTSPISATLTDGVAQSRGLLVLYRTGVKSWHVDGAGSVGTMEFETPASSVELFVRDDGPGVNSVTRVFDVNNVEILTVNGNDTDFTQVTVTRGPGETLIDRVTLENGGAGSSVWDDVTFTANNQPEADAGSNQNVTVNDLVTLDGSGSSDPDGDALSFSWTLTTPAGSGAALSNPNIVNPTFTPDVEGTYTAELIVNDGTEDSAPDTVTISADAPDNTPPVADAGPDQSVDTGVVVQLDGSGSSDADPGDTLTFSWTLTSPGGSGASLSNPNIVNPTFTPDVEGTYTATLTVSDGTDSDSDTVTITATDLPPPNTPPVADAGPDQSVATGELVTLDGSGSSDADPGDTLTFSWTLTSPAGSSAALSDPTSVSPNFTADVDGTYTAALTVSDGTDSDSDTVTITATTDNTPPVADAGPDQSVATGELVTLDGSGSSDADPGDTLTFSWTLTSPAGSSAALSDPTSVSPNFTADVDGTYTAALTVSDGTDSDSDTVTITATDDNAVPVADAGPDQSVATGELVTLDGSGSSDADPGDTLTFSWTLTAPAGSTAALSDPASVSPTFTADVAGTYTAALTVSDGTDSDSDTVTITATDDNAVPVADAGPDQSVATGELVTLDGSGSSDADPGDTLTFSWTLTAPAGSTAALSDPASVSPTFTADVAGTYTAALTVSDGTDSDSDTVTITATDDNAVPVADAGPDQSVATGELVTLDGSGSSDADPGDTLTFSWTLTSPAGSSAALSDPTSVSPNFTADVDGTYTAALTVSDGTDSDSDTVTITATTDNTPPVADAGPDQSVATGELVTLDGSGSSDADPGDTLTFSWTLTSPAGSSAALSDPTSVSPTFTADVDGTYTAALTVSDGTDSDSDTVTITATDDNAVPVADAGPDQSVATGELVTLDGSGSSDADPGDTLTFSWTLTAPAGSTAALSDPASVSPTFTADVAGTYTAALTVSDGTDSDSDTVTITATDDNAVPVADAGPDQSVATGELVTLDGSGSSDADPGDTLTFSWTLTAPAGSTAALSDPASVSPTFTADVDGTYTAELIVNDGTEDSAPDTLTITAASVEPASGVVVVANDGWTLTDDGFSNAPDTTVFVANIAEFFAGSGVGTFHAFSNAPALTGDSLAAAFADAGHTWTTGLSIPFDVDTLLGFDAIFLAGSVADNGVLIDYMDAGGNVYLAGGTGDDAQAEAEQWNAFLNNSGLEFTFPYNGIMGNITIDSPHPIFEGVSELYQISGNSIVDVRPDDPLTEILVSLDGEGLYAISEGAGVKVAIDIRPGAKVNIIIPGSTQRIPVAILSTSKAAGEAIDFDATQLDPYSVRFGPAETSLSRNQHQIRDVDGDGDEDLLLRFRALETGIQCGDTEAGLTGETLTGQRIRGSDKIKTGCK